MRPITPSQCGQDLWVLACVNSAGGPDLSKTQPTYIDIGAFDGLEISNTVLLERIGWKGVCVEPNPETFKKLQQNRQCDCYNVAVSKGQAQTVPFSIAKDPAFSGIPQSFNDRHKRTIIRTIEIQAVRFSELFRWTGFDHLTYLSLDTEGNEIEILEDALDVVQPFLISIEHNEVKERMHTIRVMARDYGYSVTSQSHDFLLRKL